MLKLAAAALVLTAAAACSPPGAWEPGDAPLRVWAPDDDAWEAFAAGCSEWAVTGLACVRERHRDAATVDVTWGDATRTASAETDYGWSLDGWEYNVTLDRKLAGAAMLVPVATHEVGHLLGIWEHLDEPGTLMHVENHSHVPTDLDIEALPFDVH